MNRYWMRMAKSCICKKRGFSLLEMSVVLLIVSLLAGGTAALLSASLQTQQLKETHAKMQMIQKALLDYRRAYHRLPCPADVTKDINTTFLNYFGVEGGSGSGNCASGIPAANFVDAGTNYYEGMVPTKTLRLPDEVAFDGWGRRIMYAVDKRFATAVANEPFKTIAITDTTTRMTVNSAAGAALTTQAVYVLISFGPNGHGAYPRAGVAVTARISFTSSNTDEQNNCDCNSSATSNANIDAIFVLKPAPLSTPICYDVFDDILVSPTRPLLRTPPQ